jgi:lysophospholipase L1-like esterase
MTALRSLVAKTTSTISTPTFPAVPREVYDLVVTSGQAVVTSATAAFTQADQGKLITGLNIPLGTTIASVQSDTQATMSAVATASFSLTTATIGTLATPVPAAAGVFAARRPGRVVNVIGDSIAPQQNATITQYGGDGAPTSSLLWAHLLSDGQIAFGKQAGIGSQRIEHMMQRLYNDVLVYPAQFCIIQTGTNDLSAGTSTAAWAGYIQQMCAALLAVGQTPVLVTCPPVPSAYRSAADKYRRWIVAFALRNGLPLVDAYSALADTTGTGGYASGLDSGDGIHPSAAGYRAYGQAIVDALAGHLLPGNPPVARVNAIASSGSLVDNGLFLTDTNSDGVPDGWTKSGTGAGVSSIVTGDSAIVGNAMRLVDTGNTGSVTYAYTTSATTPVGGRVAFSGRIKIAGNGPVRLTAYVVGVFPGPGRVSYATTAFGVTNATNGWKRFYLEVPNTTGTTPVVKIEFTAPGAVDTDASIAQIAVHDLSGLGL